MAKWVVTKERRSYSYFIVEAEDRWAAERKGCRIPETVTTYNRDGGVYVSAYMPFDNETSYMPFVTDTMLSPVGQPDHISEHAWYDN